MKLTLLAAVVAALIVAPSASALSKNNNGATLNISPAQPVLGDTVTFSGCNYQPNFAFVLTVQANNKMGAYALVVPAVTDNSGCLAPINFTPPGMGTWYSVVYFGVGHKVSSLSFDVG